MQKHVKLLFGIEDKHAIEESLKECQEMACKNFGKSINFYAPSFIYYKTRFYCSSSTDFPTISVTGSSCALKCKHCNGKVLETMYSAVTPEKLVEVCKRLKNQGASGCLISGGCLPDGSVPLGRFIEAIREVKQTLNLTVLVHSGIVDFQTAESLKKSGVDAVLIDVIGSDETIKEIYNLNACVKDYENALKALHEAKIAFVPHVIVGLHYGQLKGELRALEIASKYDPSAVVVIAFMPIRETDMANFKPPKPIDIAKTVAAARLMFPQTPLALGCMRPKGKHRAETDILAIKAGVNAIAFPAEEAVKFAESQGYSLSFSSVCCSQVYLNINKA